MPKRILSLFRNLFRKRSMEEALDDELRWTLDALIETVFETILESRSARAIAKFEEWEAAEEIREESIFLTFRRSRWQAA